MILTHYFIKRKINRLLLSARRNRRFKTISEIQNVLLLCHAEDAKEVEQCAVRLKKEGKKVAICMYETTAAASRNDDSDTFYVCPAQDVTVWGFPESSVMQQVAACNPDIVIDLTRKKEYVMQYLLLRSECDFKAGIRSEENAFYDFSVSATENKELSYLFEQIIFYLQTIRSK
ncbi:MAG: hypothetical protein LIP00_03030 [Parabacteroides sp.]|nr:hypothetical protein [Parabacteroides sp.]